jgi:hypothetical protein
MAAGATYEPIATTTLGTATSSFTFSSIPATYTDLRLVIGWVSGTNPRIRFNSDTATSYSQTAMYGDGTAASFAQSNQDGLNIYAYGVSTQPPFYTLDLEKEYKRLKSEYSAMMKKMDNYVRTQDKDQTTVK